ncbi:MAG: RNA 2',3'-cyclic phosphodiesterase [Anaerolineae bacterium]|nr:RNA 2',3'-cyclic phosphodiesterase [Anaerolineae bacterium]
MMATLRAFIAIDLSEEVKAEIGMVLRKLQAVSPVPVKWVSPDNIHLTLKFLGDIQPAQVERVGQFLRTEICQFSSFSLTLTGLGAFPNMNRPRVIWIGIGDQPLLLSLQAVIEKGLERLGFPAEQRSFKPHLTLGRVKDSATVGDLKAIAKRLSEIEPRFLASQQVRFVCLYRSILQPAGPIYEQLFRVLLK